MLKPITSGITVFPDKSVKTNPAPTSDLLNGIIVPAEMNGRLNLVKRVENNLTLFGNACDIFNCRIAKSSTVSHSLDVSHVMSEVRIVLQVTGHLASV